LAVLEKTIARGKKTFIEVGMALAEIRDLRLYRREYGSFSEYCREKWGWNKSYAYYMIEGAEVVKSLPGKMSTIVDTEGQARELAKIPVEARAGIVQAIVDAGEPVTAAAIKRHLPPVPTQPGGAQANSPVVAPPPAPVVDGTGWPIPTHLIPLWKRMDEVQEMLTTLSRVKGALRTAQENKDKLFTEVNFSSALSQLDQAWADIKTAKPFAVCPTCQGQLPDQCALCRGRGLISEHRWNTCVTREDKAFREKAKARQPAGGQSKAESACRTGQQPKR
ncbi:MAG: hypothetical protein WCH99_18530, partial [Verrucomicrobiota bacterium]